MTLYEHLVSPLLRVLDPEQSHTLTMRLLGAAQGVPGVVPVVHRLSEAEDPRMAVSWKGLRFPNPIGLAAGADKDAAAHALLAALGFGFIEVGTVTPEPQRGNPKPRMFRLRDRKAMINSLGFPSKGADHVRQRLERRQVDIPVGINLGKNAGTPLESTALDYGQPLEMLHHHGDYFVLNVSSPNTPGLRDLQASPALADLAAVLAEKRHSLAAAAGGPVKPLLVKVSPDLDREGIDGVLEAVARGGIDGVIAVNTSTSADLKGPLQPPGGISGQPLRERALEVVGHIRRNGPPGLLVVGVGGVFDHTHAWALLREGADLVQLYTGLVYRGPGLVRNLLKGLGALLDEAGLGSIRDIRS